MEALVAAQALKKAESLKEKREKRDAQQSKVYLGGEKRDAQQSKVCLGGERSGMHNSQRYAWGGREALKVGGGGLLLAHF